MIEDEIIREIHSEHRDIDRFLEEKRKEKMEVLNNLKN